MTAKAITKVSLIQVGMNGHAPCYKYRDDLDVTNGEHVKAVYEYLRPNPARTAHNHGQKPERFLDIKVKYNVYGNCLFLFDLDLMGLNQKKLQFPKNGNKFIFLPINYGASAPFLEEVQSYDGGGELWGGFSCDLDILRASTLATGIKNFGGLHKHGIRVPFYFNFVDQDLLGHPWVVPDHPSTNFTDHDPESPDSEEHGHEHRREDEEHRQDTGGATHGGVHPSSLAFLSIDF